MRLGTGMYFKKMGEKLHKTIYIKKASSLGKQ